MKLYEVNIECVAMVWAKDRQAAERQVYHDIREVMDGADYTASEVTLSRAIYSDWCGSIPFGEAPEGFSDLTCDEIMARWAEDGPAVDKDTLPLPRFA